VPFASVSGRLRQHGVNIPKPAEKISLPLHLALEPECSFFAAGTGSICSMGAFSYTNGILGFGTYVGRYCSIASGVGLLGAEHFPDWISTSPAFYERGYHSAGPITENAARMTAQVLIGHDVWIGSSVTIKRRVRIGNGVLIGAHSLVTKDVEDFAIVGGVPARVIRKRFPDHIIERIQRLAWWRYHKDDLKFGNAQDPERFLDDLEERVAAGIIAEYRPPILRRGDLLDS
jgi:virginiamycin A acetyltransferase